jgi:hypothetical protein
MKTALKITLAILFLASMGLAVECTHGHSGLCVVGCACGCKKPIQAKKPAAPAKKANPQPTAPKTKN